MLHKKQAKLREYIRELYGVQHVEKPFRPGETHIPYSGRVFDENEIIAAVESCLEFWLTLGNNGKKFEEKIADYLNRRYAIREMLMEILSKSLKNKPSYVNAYAQEVLI